MTKSTSKTNVPFSKESFGSLCNVKYWQLMVYEKIQLQLINKIGGIPSCQELYIDHI